MKQKTIALTLMALFIATILPTLIINTVAIGGSGNENSPYRILNTNLNYVIPNGTYFMYNNSQTIIASGTVGNGTINGTETHDHEVLTSNWNYDVERFTSEKIDNGTSKIVIRRYYNTTDNPVCPADIDEWSYYGNNTSYVNNTLIGLMYGQNYMPRDVYIDDIFTNDTSFYQAMMVVMEFDPFIDIIWDAVSNLTDSGNITIFDLTNTTRASIKNRYEGEYIYNMSVDALVNDIMGLSNFAINVTFLFDIYAKMSCYHNLENTLMNLTFQIQLVNNSNPLQFANIELSMIMQGELICSTLVPCAWGYEFFGGNEFFDYFGVNWWWILVAIGGTFILVIGIGFAVQRNKCPTYKQPLDHWACRVGSKYKELPK